MHLSSLHDSRLRASKQLPNPVLILHCRRRLLRRVDVDVAAVIIHGPFHEPHQIMAAYPHASRIQSLVQGKCVVFREAVFEG